ncbi:UDP-2,3-diacylglucosamine diphosphatase [Moraxella sp. FZLJ2107]|uniref:UDP-2,3-diacylglucosamine diphosphatase n=1 Tax=unclassified Moraxella TaxID=2685852 RepID=UPI0020C83702|nr:MULTISPECIES: UDP-2,3-diacylglucosamine diphosphatase [unclassified Moraxella]UTO05144.1 UDP-2,3-diacylglucosamine diphosphatase [Moraxella sp. FZLJ2107]UTO21879.1 UDP-2,3-diacylglucosamine diphosphatase [Moraxella sp. FZLJ2109]
MHSADYYFTTKPSEIQAVFVSDLHLSAHTPKLAAAFIRLIEDLCHLPNLNSLYILGDWLDAWIGDDAYLSLDKQTKDMHWLTPIIKALKKLSDKKVQILVMHGNRDFALSDKLTKLFGGAIIAEPYYLTTSTHRIRLEHGDALCTDDVKYQQYRAIIRHPAVRWLLLATPLSFRSKLGKDIKDKSHNDKRQKSATIMDVNHDAVQKALTDCDILLHGHTHRPAVHLLGNKARLVLGDWRYDDRQVTAEIGLLIGYEIVLANFSV